MTLPHIYEFFLSFFPSPYAWMPISGYGLVYVYITHLPRRLHIFRSVDWNAAGLSVCIVGLIKMTSYPYSMRRDFCGLLFQSVIRRKEDEENWKSYNQHQHLLVQNDQYKSSSCLCLSEMLLLLYHAMSGRWRSSIWMDRWTMIDSEIGQKARKFLFALAETGFLPSLRWRWWSK